MDNSVPPPGLIGVFDSGVGGLSVLRALRKRLPGTPMLYLADSGYAPYGDRTADDVAQRSARVIDHLARQGASMVVIACNTATTLAIGALRARWPGLPIVGVEPGVKPAVRLTRNRRIGVLATHRTIHSERLRRLLQEHASACEVTLQPCPGLVDAIESGMLDEEAMHRLVGEFCAPLRTAGVDTVVLGCTHYPFVASHIQRWMGEDVTLVDTAEAVAERTAAVWQNLAGESPRGQAGLGLQTTGEPGALSGFAARWLGLDQQAVRADL
jgi:glutamate racemase